MAKATRTQMPLMDSTRLSTTTLSTCGVGSLRDSSVPAHGWSSWRTMYGDVRKTSWTGEIPIQQRVLITARGLGVAGEFRNSQDSHKSDLGCGQQQTVSQRLAKLHDQWGQAGTAPCLQCA